MKKEDLLNDDFLKQFKSGEELNDFLKQIQKRGIEKMLEGELDGHLGYDKNKSQIILMPVMAIQKRKSAHPWASLTFRFHEIVMLLLIP